MFKRLGLAVALLGATLGASACATDGYGRGYGGLSAGYGGFYGDPYYGGGIAGPATAGLGYGWYDGFYYPGTGAFVYDRYRRARPWNDVQRRYWQGRPGFARPGVRANWRDFRRDVANERRDYRGDLRANRRAYRAGTIDRGQFLQGRRDARRAYRSDVRRDYRDLRRQNRALGVATPRPNGAFRATPGRGYGTRGFGGRSYGGRGFGGRGYGGRGAPRL